MWKYSLPLVLQGSKWDLWGCPSNPWRYANITWKGEVKMFVDSLFFKKKQSLTTRSWIVLLMLLLWDSMNNFWVLLGMNRLASTSIQLIIPLWINPLTGFQWLVIYDFYCSHKSYGTFEPLFSSAKGYLPSITSVSKLPIWQ